MSTSMLTVGMAHHSDFNGAWFTIQHFRHHQGFSAEALEIVVVDNSPLTAHGTELAKFCAKLQNCKYVPLPDVVGTSVPRNRVFEEASAPWVLCVDCHVMLRNFGMLANLAAIGSPPDWEPLVQRSMLTGPMLHSSGAICGTHWNDQWRAHMWGTWGSAWQCRCGEFNFTYVETNGRIEYRELVSQIAIDKCSVCDRELPSLPEWMKWDQVPAVLLAENFVSLGEGEYPFEIPGMGLGLFLMRKDMWVGFHPDARGFGGEEMWVHEKVRRAGGKVLCLPSLAWLHRTERVGGVPYPLHKKHRVRNYMLEFDQLGMDYAPIYRHFVTDGNMTQASWEACLRGEVAPPKAAMPEPGEETLDSLYLQWGQSDDRAALIRHFAARHDDIAIIGADDPRFDVFVAAGRPKRIRSFPRVEVPALSEIHDVIRRTETSRSAERRTEKYVISVGFPRPIPVCEAMVLISTGRFTAESARLIAGPMMRRVSKELLLIDDVAVHRFENEGGAA